MNKNPKIKLTDSTTDIFVKMAEGNPGAVAAMFALVKEEPDRGFMAILALDDEGVYGSHIWMGYKDCCGQDAPKFLEACLSRDPVMLQAARCPA